MPDLLTPEELDSILLEVAPGIGACCPEDIRKLIELEGLIP